MVTTRISPAEQLLRSANGLGNGSGSEIPGILKKMGTFARAVATEEYQIEQGFAFDSGLIFPIIGINHLVTRGIFEPLGRSISGLADSDKGAAALGTANVAMENPDKFFENAENHFSATTIEALKACINISANITTAEKDGKEIKISAEQLKIAEMSLRGIESAISDMADKNPEMAGLKELTGDMKTISTHYSAMAKKLLPKLTSAPQQDNNS